MCRTLPFRKRYNHSTTTVSYPNRNHPDQRQELNHRTPEIKQMRKNKFNWYRNWIYIFTHINIDKTHIVSKIFSTSYYLLTRIIDGWLFRQGEVPFQFNSIHSRSYFLTYTKKLEWIEIYWNGTSHWHYFCILDTFNFSLKQKTNQIVIIKVGW